MRPRHIVFASIISGVFVVIGTSFALEYIAQKRGAELWEKVKRSAPTGESREVVETNLGREGLPFGYSAPSNVIVSPWIPIGRFRLIWQTQFYFQIAFNDQGRVTGFTTQRFNEGL